jgi:hypothetical protein
MIANHQIDADWWFSWELARAYKLHGRLKIILKVRYPHTYLGSIIKQSIGESIRVSRFGASVSFHPTSPDTAMRHINLGMESMLYQYRADGMLKCHAPALWPVQADLKNIPVMGWGMRQFEFLFLDRKWESDRQRLYRSDPTS